MVSRFYCQSCKIFSEKTLISLRNFLIVESCYPLQLLQKPFQNPVKCLRWSFFAKIVNGIKPLIIFAKRFYIKYLTWLQYLCLRYLINQHIQRFLQQLSKTIPESYLQPSRTSTMEFFCVNAIHYFRKKATSQIFKLVLNTPLYFWRITVLKTLTKASLTEFHFK